MTMLNAIAWMFAFASLATAATFFWRRQKFAGLTFIIVSIIVLAGASEKRVVLTSAMLGLTFEHDVSSR